MRTVPDGITRPPYLATGGRPAGRAGLQILTGDELERMRVACRVAAEVLLETGAAVSSGMTTDELDRIAHEAYLSRGAYPSTLGYNGFSKSVCTSVNEVVCHGIPDSRVLRDGDIVNIDVTAYIEGMHGDTSATFAVGPLDDPTEVLVDVTCRATLAGIAAIAPGCPLGVVGEAIESLAHEYGLGVVRDYGGHGIGSVFHGEPHVNHTKERGSSLELVPGLTFTVEPMITAGTFKHTQWDDDWTEVTDDLLPTAQFEHTVIVTTDGVEILTVTADGDTAVRWPNRLAEAVAAESLSSDLPGSAAR